MSCLGVHFSLESNEVQELLQLQEGDVVAHVQDVFEEQYLGTPRAVESDKSWDAMHRVLSGGTLAWDEGGYPLSFMVLRGKPMYSGADYIVSLKEPGLVADISRALRGVSKQDFRKGYDSLDQTYQGKASDQDFEYTWEYFQEVREFYLRAAEEGMSVLFTADQ